MSAIKEASDHFWYSTREKDKKFARRIYKEFSVLVKAESLAGKSENFVKEVKKNPNLFRELIESPIFKELEDSIKDWKRYKKFAAQDLD